MSHVAKIELEIRDIEALKMAAKLLGLDFRKNQTTFRWFGRSVGDFPLPSGTKESDLGKCEHAIGLPNNKTAYEIGVIKRRDGKAGYTLLWDFWNGGHGLEKVVGKEGNKLKQSYAEAVATRSCRAKGFKVQRTVKSDGKVVLTAVK